MLKNCIIFRRLGLWIQPVAFNWPFRAPVLSVGYNRMLQCRLTHQETTNEWWHSREPDEQQIRILEMMCKSSCAWPDSNMCVLPLISRTPPPPPLHSLTFWPSIPIPHTPPPQPLNPLLSSHYFNPLHHPAILSSIPHTPTTPTTPSPPSLQMASTS